MALWNLTCGYKTRWKKIMAKISSYVPEPKQQYDVENQRQILQSVDSIKNELNFSYQKDLKEEQDTYNYFLS